MVEIRTEIWDYLYKYGPTSLDTIARALGQSLQTVEAAVDHEWFAMRADVAAIAIHETGDVRSRGEEHAMSDEESNQFLQKLFGSGG